jgi:hypothetical protein
VEELCINAEVLKQPLKSPLGRYAGGCRETVHNLRILFRNIFAKVQKVRSRIWRMRKDGVAVYRLMIRKVDCLRNRRNQSNAVQVQCTYRKYHGKAIDLFEGYLDGRKKSKAR